MTATSRQKEASNPSLRIRLTGPSAVPGTYARIGRWLGWRSDARDCVPIGMGHHNMPEIDDGMRATFFKTTAESRKPLGHLWNHRLLACDLPTLQD